MEIKQVQWHLRSQYSYPHCMDRQRRSASKVTDYRRYHLSGDLEQVVQGKVSGTVELLETGIMNTETIKEDTTPEELEALLKEWRESSMKLHQQAETMRLRNQLEVEQKQQEQWELAIQQLKQERDRINHQHEENMEKMKHMTQAPADQAVAWLKAQLNIAAEPPKEDTVKSAALERLYKQQEELHKQIADITNGAADSHQNPGTMRRDQEALLEQISTTLAPKDTDRDPNKVLLRALLTAQSKTPGAGGVNMLRSDILHKLTGEGEFSMAKWLASLNKQEEGESDISRVINK